MILIVILIVIVIVIATKRPGRQHCRAGNLKLRNVSEFMSPFLFRINILMVSYNKSKLGLVIIDKPSA
jgi:hypothetical protein